MIPESLAPEANRSGRSAALTTLAVLLLIFSRCAPLISQTDAPQPPASQLAPVLPTLSLSESIRTAKLESEDPEIMYQNGFFLNFDGTGHILIRNKNGHITGDFNLRPQETLGPHGINRFMHDVAIFKDGSIVASWIYRVQPDERRYFNLVHYDQSGKLLEQIDLGKWRATRICIADDKSIWTLSGEEELGYPVYSPDEGVLRNYKFGSGMLGAVVPRSNFRDQFHNTYSIGRVAIDCTGEKVHALTEDGEWLEYKLGANFTITPIESFSHSTFGDFWRMIGFAYLNGGHAYAVIHSVPGDPFRRMLAELLPSGDGRTLRWVEVPPEKAIVANNQPSDPAHSADKPKEPVAVTGVLGADHEDGEQLVYRTSKDETILWSKPLFGSAGSH